MGNKRNILDLALVFLLLLAVQGFKISHLEEKPDSEAAQNPADASSSSYATTIIISPFFSLEPKLNSFNVQKLEEEQKEVDNFIRKNTQVGDSKLTEAKGNENFYVFSYEKKSDQKDELWVVSVSRKPEGAKQEDKGSEQKEKKQQKQGQKYLISGINYIKNSKLSDEEKKKIEEQLKRSREEFEQAGKQFNEQMRQFGKDMEEFFRSW